LGGNPHLLGKPPNYALRIYFATFLGRRKPVQKKVFELSLQSCNLDKDYSYDIVIVFFMNWISTTETAIRLKISNARVRQLLAKGRIKGACKIGKYWMIPLFDGKPSIQTGTRGPKPRWSSARAKAKTKIYINRAKLAENKNRETFHPVISVNRVDRNMYGHEVAIDGPCRIVYHPDLDKNPRIWIETFFQVRVFNFEPDRSQAICRTVN
jgi:hypothetical protein